MSVNAARLLEQMSGDTVFQYDVPGSKPRVWSVASAKLPTRFGYYTVVAFANDRDGKEHIALVHGDVRGAEDVPVRLHSECLTGDVLGSLRCDCRDQIEYSLRYLAGQERGVLLYLRQEGRGIGLINKIRAYALQDSGLDTVEANQALGFHDDERDYAIAAGMLKALGVKSIKLLSNNPRKFENLRENGVEITERIPLVRPANRFNQHYLETKARKSGHMFRLDELCLTAK
jgi:GTP cyclohydrolase II